MLRARGVGDAPAAQAGRGRGACVLTFHRVLGACERDHDLTWDAFTRVLDEIARSGGAVVPELAFEPAARDAVVLTFDDGTADHLRVAETLAARGMAGIFFVPAQTMGRRGRLTAREVRALCALGHRVGSHGLTDEPIGAAATRDVLRRELGESRAILEDAAGAPVVYFAPPGGRLSGRARRALPGFGYLASRSMRWGIYGAPEDCFQIPCIPVTEYTVARGWVGRAVAARRVPASMRSAAVVRRMLPEALRTPLRRALHAPFLARDRAPGPRGLDGGGAPPPEDARLKVLLSAYACEPGRGSEPGVGWNAVRVLERRHDLWVLTRANNRRAIEDALSRQPLPHARFVYHDLPVWARWWKRGPLGVQIYYYLWQLGIYRLARRLHRTVGFDLAHHVTFGKYWAPSLLWHLPVPFVWGPVGGGESAPRPFWRDFGLGGRLFETAREAGRWCGEHDPLVRLTAGRCALALAKAKDTAVRLRALGARDVEVYSEGGLLMADLGRLARCPEPPPGPIRFTNVGRLLHLKGFHLGLRAFARAGIAGSEYWVIGDGPERRRLEAEARALGVTDRVRFWGWLSHAETLERLEHTHVLVHPTLHDSGGGVTLEAMASGRPVICLDLGGPSAQVVDGSGIKVAARDPDQAVRDLAQAMRRVAGDPAMRTRMGAAGRKRSREAYAWEDQGRVLTAFYRRAMEGRRG